MLGKSETLGSLDEKELSEKQAIKYAKELSILYSSEQEKRKQLEKNQVFSSSSTFLISPNGLKGFTK